MKHRKGILLLVAFIFLVGGVVGLPSVSSAVQPDAKTVPWVAGNPLIPHDAFNGEATSLKGTSSHQGSNFQYTWDFGDGSLPATGTVTNQYVVEATHAYTGIPGDIFTATLTIRDTNTNEFDSANYFVAIRDKVLETEVNVAIDEGLWYLHKTMTRTGSQGYWSGYNSAQAANLNAFFVNGHLETGENTNPYTETVQRGMQHLFSDLSTVVIGTQPSGDPDSNGNGIGIRSCSDGCNNDNYSSGMYMDAIVASGTPNATAPTGPADVVGRAYKDIVQDMVDFYAWGQNDNPSSYYAASNGGWYYTENAYDTDNSVSQWAAIGLLAARSWSSYGVFIPSWVETNNVNSVTFTQYTPTGQFYYRRLTYGLAPWGPWAPTASGMVQMVMDNIDRSSAMWNLTETYVRNNFCNAGGYTTAIRSYLYALFSFTKSMLLYPGGALQFLGAGPTPAPIDWYSAQTSTYGGTDPCDGVARVLVNGQQSAGNWNDSGSGYHAAFSTAWAIIMLNRTVFASGVPVAVAEAIPNPGVVGQAITLDGSDSFHQDPAKSIDSWEWDLDDDGEFDDASGPVVTTSFPALGNYFVGLRVTDNADPEDSDTTTITVQITTPPVAPTADANGPYVFCPQTQPWFLDGTGSVNPDEGQSIPPNPGDTIQEYAWELDGLDSDFDEAFGPQPDVTAFFTAQGVGDYLIRLRVKDTTSTSYPGLNPPFDQDLSDTDSAQVSVKDASDPDCGCIDDLTARPKSGKVQLVWSDIGAASYHVYRGTFMGGPYMYIANTTSTYSTYLDTGLANGTTYYYVVRPAALNGDELCQSNDASATPTARIR